MSTHLRKTKQEDGKLALKQKKKKQDLILWCSIGGGALVLALVLFFFRGLGVKTKELTPEQANLHKFARLYFEFRTKQNRPPASAEELQNWAKKLDKKQLGTMGIDDVGQTCVSPRDHKPYEVVQLPMGMGPVLAHEQVGDGSGRRLIVSSNGQVIEVDQAKFDGMMRSIPKAPAGPSRPYGPPPQKPR